MKKRSSVSSARTPAVIAAVALGLSLSIMGTGALASLDNTLTIETAVFPGTRQVPDFMNNQIKFIPTARLRIRTKSYYHQPVQIGISAPLPEKAKVTRVDGEHFCQQNPDIPFVSCQLHTPGMQPGQEHTLIVDMDLSAYCPDPVVHNHTVRVEDFAAASVFGNGIVPIESNAVVIFATCKRPQAMPDVGGGTGGNEGGGTGGNEGGNTGGGTGGNTGGGTDGGDGEGNLEDWPWIDGGGETTGGGEPEWFWPMGGTPPCDPAAYTRWMRMMQAMPPMPVAPTHPSAPTTGMPPDAMPPTDGVRPPFPPVIYQPLPGEGNLEDFPVFVPELPSWNAPDNLEDFPIFTDPEQLPPPSNLEDFPVIGEPWMTEEPMFFPMRVPEVEAPSFTEPETMNSPVMPTEDDSEGGWFWMNWFR